MTGCHTTCLPAYQSDRLCTPLHMTYTYRLLARAVKRDLFGNIVPVDSIPPAVSGKFVVSRTCWGCPCGMPGLLSRV